MASRMDSSMTPMVEIAPITSSAVAQTTAALSSGGTAGFYRIAATGAIYYKVRGTEATPVDASANSALLPAGVVEVVQVPAGGTISVLQVTAPATVSITGMR